MWLMIGAGGLLTLALVANWQWQRHARQTRTVLGHRASADLVRCALAYVAERLAAGTAAPQVAQGTAAPQASPGAWLGAAFGATWQHVDALACAGAAGEGVRIAEAAYLQTHQAATAAHRESRLPGYAPTASADLLNSELLLALACVHAGELRAALSTLHRTPFACLIEADAASVAALWSAAPESAIAPTVALPYREMPTATRVIAAFLLARLRYWMFELRAGCTGPYPPLIHAGDVAVLTLARAGRAGAWVIGTDELDVAPEIANAAVHEHREQTAVCLYLAAWAWSHGPAWSDAGYLTARLLSKIGAGKQSAAVYAAVAPGLIGRPLHAVLQRDVQDLADPATALAQFAHEAGASAADRDVTPPQGRRSPKLRVLS